MTRLVSLCLLHEQCCCERCVLNIAQRIINSSNACGYASCSLSLHVNTFHGLFVVCEMLTSLFYARRSVDGMKDLRTMYDTKERRSSVQWILI